jgi:hypothetical protein
MIIIFFIECFDVDEDESRTLSVNCHMGRSLISDHVFKFSMIM